MKSAAKPAGDIESELGAAARESVVLSLEDAVATIAFNRPQAMNTLTLETIGRLHDLLIDVERRADIRCLVIKGEGRVFMAGGDLGYLDAAGERAPEEARKVIDALNAAMGLLVELSKPTVACVHGAVAGAGNSIMLACDMALAAAGTKFVYAYGAIASASDGGLSWSLPRVVGMRRALEIAYLPQQITAEQALSYGLVNRVVDPAALESETAALARRLAEGPTLALAATRRLMRDGQTRTFDQQLVAEREAFCAAAATEDFREGVRAFFERRPANFAGK